MTPLERLLLETIPIRPTPPDPARRNDGPTARWLQLEREREKWRIVSEVTRADKEAGAA